MDESKGPIERKPHELPADQLSTESITTTKPLSEDRLSISKNARIAGGIGLAFLAGSSLGISHGSKDAGMRFRAENAHRLPRTQGDWYLYHKSKNYNAIVGGVKEGVKMGTKVGLWSGGFFAIEDLVDERRGRKDFISTAVAGLTIGSAFSLWNRFPMMTALRTAKTGLYGGIAFGLAQDVLGLLRGRRLGYVDFITQHTGLSDRSSIT